MSIRIENLTKQFGSVVVIPDLNIQFEMGKISVLLGPSGCGKTTTLRCIAGLEQPTSGRIFLEETTVFDSRQRINRQPEERDIGMVFQSYAIWPHMTVFENIALPLKARSIPRAELIIRVREALEIVGLSAFADRSATRLSGGQQQRVAIARGLVSRPKVILLDEPLSNLDAKLRLEMRREIKDLQRKTGATMLFVTHDQEEAMFLADKVFLFDKGKVAQAGTPQELYFHPCSRFVAEFLGEANLVPARLRSEDDQVDIVTSSGQILASGDELGRFEGLNTALIRPEAWHIKHQTSTKQSAGGGMPGKITDVTFLGDRLSLRIATPVGNQLVSAPGHARHQVDDNVLLNVDKSNIQMISA